MKEFFLPLTEPVGAVWAFMFVGCLWLLIRKQWRGAFWLGVPTVALFVLGSTTLIEGLVEKEEQQWEYHSLWNLVQRPGLRGKDHETTDQSGKDYGTTANGLAVDPEPRNHGTLEKTEGKDHETTGPRDHETVEKKTTDPGLLTTVQKGEDHGTTGPQDYGTSEKTDDKRPRTTDQGGKDHGTTGLRDYGTTEKTNGTRAVDRRLVFSGRGGNVADVVVVLGGGTRMSHFDGYQFAPVDAFSRVLTGIELVRAGRAKVMILGGSYPRPGKPQEPGMVAIQDWVQAWGLCRVDGGEGEQQGDMGGVMEQPVGSRTDKGRGPLSSTNGAAGLQAQQTVGLLSPALSYPGGRPPGGEGGASQGQSGFVACLVTNLGICLNTHDEALAFKRMKQFQDWNSVMLVTSALHMKRSVALFKKLGIKVEPVASDFEVFGVSQDLPFSIFPRQHRFRLWGLWLHEKIGMMVYGRRGWV